MSHKLVSARAAAELVKDGDTLTTSGFVGIGVPDELLRAIEERFLETGSPRDLSLVFAAGQGDGKERGLNRLGHDGLLKRVVGGHWALIPKLGALATSGRIEAYNLPQGCISQLYRDIAAGRPGLISRVGLETFVDPRNGGGRINDATTEETRRAGRARRHRVALLSRVPDRPSRCCAAPLPTSRATSPMEREAFMLDNLAQAMAVRNCGGVVIVQVERVAAAGALRPRDIVIPGILVDCRRPRRAREPRADLRHRLQPGLRRRVRARPARSRRCRSTRAR